MRRPIRWLAGILAILVVSASVLWLNRDWMIAQVYIHTMEWEGRVESLSVDRVLEVMALAPGQRVADIGSGTGLFTRPFARAVGASGVAYAVDVKRRSSESRPKDEDVKKLVETVISDSRSFSDLRP